MKDKFLHNKVMVSFDVATIRKLGLEPDSTCVVLVVSVFAQRKKISVNKQIRINLIDINGKEINKYHTKTIIK